MSEHTIGGRLVRVTCLGRVRSKVGRSYYNLMSIVFIDTGERLTMGAAQFAKWADKLDREAKVRA